MALVRIRGIKADENKVKLTVSEVYASGVVAESPEFDITIPDDAFTDFESFKRYINGVLLANHAKELKARLWRDEDWNVDYGS